MIAPSESDVGTYSLEMTLSEGDDSYSKTMFLTVAGSKAESSPTRESETAMSKTSEEAKTTEESVAKEFTVNVNQIL